MFWSFSWETMGHLYLIYPNWIHFAGGVWNQQPVMIFRQWAQFKKQTYGTPEKCFLYIVFHVVQAHFFKPHVFVHLFPIKYLDFLHRLPQGPSATLTCSASAWIGDSDFKFLIVKTVKIFLMGNQVTNTAEFTHFFGLPGIPTENMGCANSSDLTTDDNAILGSYWDILGRYIISPTIARIIPNHRMEIKVSLEAGSKHILEATLVISDDWTDPKWVSTSKSVCLLKNLTDEEKQ